MNTENIILSNNCHFHLGDTPDAWQAWYDDSDWQEITLPHDWSVTLPFDRSCSSGTGYLPGGIGWYRIHIKPQEEWQGKQISICFDGVYKNSRVWCNSYYLANVLMVISAFAMILPISSASTQIISYLCMLTTVKSQTQGGIQEAALPEKYLCV